GPRLVGTAFVIRILQEGVALADLLGKDDDVRRWRARVGELTRRFDEEFFDAETGTYRTERPVGFRQTSQAVPLLLGLVPKERVNPVVARLAADVERKGHHLDTGSIGTSALPFALTDHGDPPRPDLAHAVLQQRTYPGYGYLRSLGATTFWESWEKDSRGHNDSTLSSPVRWLVERVVGVEPIAPGWARLRVAPRAFGTLPGAGVALDTVRGRVSVRWRRSGRRVRLEVEVPVNATAEVTLPDGRTLAVGSGRYRWESTLPPRR
ncbi:MAG TPA: alpha-L-rhamnosidase C-terminal domain-containing protein, partial [Actinopolymorphaceae bacterium]